MYRDSSLDPWNSSCSLDVDLAVDSRVLNHTGSEKNK